MAKGKRVIVAALVTLVIVSAITPASSQWFRGKHRGKHGRRPGPGGPRGGLRPPAIMLPPAADMNSNFNTVGQPVLNQYVSFTTEQSAFPPLGLPDQSTTPPPPPPVFGGNPVVETPTPRPPPQVLIATTTTTTEATTTTTTQSTTTPSTTTKSDNDVFSDKMIDILRKLGEMTSGDLTSRLSEPATTSATTTTTTTTTETPRNLTVVAAINGTDPVDAVKVADEMTFGNVPPPAIEYEPSQKFKLRLPPSPFNMLRGRPPHPGGKPQHPGSKHQQQGGKHHHPGGKPPRPPAPSSSKSGFFGNMFSWNKRPPPQHPPQRGPMPAKPTEQGKEGQQQENNNPPMQPVRRLDYQMGPPQDHQAQPKHPAHPMRREDMRKRPPMHFTKPRLPQLGLPSRLPTIGNVATKLFLMARGNERAPEPTTTTTTEKPEPTTTPKVITIMDGFPSASLPLHRSMEVQEEDRYHPEAEKRVGGAADEKSKTMSILAKLSPKKPIMVFMKQEGIVETTWAGADPGKVVKKYAGSTKIQFFNGTIPRDSIPPVFLAPGDMNPPKGYGKIPIPKITKSSDPPPTSATTTTTPKYLPIEDQIRLLRLQREQIKLRKQKLEAGLLFPEDPAFGDSSTNTKIIKVDGGKYSPDFYNQIRSSLPKDAIIESIEQMNGKRPTSSYTHDAVDHYSSNAFRRPGDIVTRPTPEAPVPTVPAPLSTPSAKSQYNQYEVELPDISPTGLMTEAELEKIVSSIIGSQSEAKFSSPYDINGLNPPLPPVPKSPFPPRGIHQLPSPNLQSGPSKPALAPGFEYESFTNGQHQGAGNPYNHYQKPAQPAGPPSPQSVGQQHSSNHYTGRPYENRGPNGHLPVQTPPPVHQHLPNPLPNQGFQSAGNGPKDYYESNYQFNAHSGGQSQQQKPPTDGHQVGSMPQPHRVPPPPAPAQPSPYPQNNGQPVTQGNIALFSYESANPSKNIEKVKPVLQATASYKKPTSHEHSSRERYHGHKHSHEERENGGSPTIIFHSQKLKPNKKPMVVITGANSNNMKNVNKIINALNHENEGTTADRTKEHFAYSTTAKPYENDYNTPAPYVVTSPKPPQFIFRTATPVFASTPSPVVLLQSGQSPLPPSIVINNNNNNNSAYMEDQGVPKFSFDDLFPPAQPATVLLQDAQQPQQQTFVVQQGGQNGFSQIFAQQPQQQQVVFQMNSPQPAQQSFNNGPNAIVVPNAQGQQPLPPVIFLPNPPQSQQQAQSNLYGGAGPLVVSQQPNFFQFQAPPAPRPNIITQDAFDKQVLEQHEEAVAQIARQAQQQQQKPQNPHEYTEISRGPTVNKFESLLPSTGISELFVAGADLDMGESNPRPAFNKANIEVQPIPTVALGVRKGEGQQAQRRMGDSGADDVVLEKVKTEEKIVWERRSDDDENLVPMKITTQETSYVLPNGRTEVRSSVIDRQVAEDLVGKQPLGSFELLKRSGEAEGSSNLMKAPAATSEPEPQNVSPFVGLLKQKAELEKYQQENRQGGNHFQDFRSTVFG